MQMQRLIISSVAKPAQMQKLHSSSVEKARCFLGRLGWVGQSGSNCGRPVAASYQDKIVSSLFFHHNDAFPATLLQRQLLGRNVQGTDHGQPSRPSTADTPMHIFSAADQERRESRNKWLEAAQAVAGRSVEGESSKPSLPQRFLVDGSEIYLSTSPVIPGHSTIHYKGMATKLFIMSCLFHMDSVRDIHRGV